MSTLRRIYHASTGPMRAQLWMTCVMVGVVFAAVVSGQAPTPVMSSDAWFTPQNLISLCILIYGVGTTVQSGRDMKRRLDHIEKCVNEEIPAIYVRKDVFEERLGRRAADLIRPGTP